jgi:hypothetical protein
VNFVFLFAAQPFAQVAVFFGSFPWAKIRPRPGTSHAYARIGGESFSGSDRMTGRARNFAEIVRRSAALLRFEGIQFPLAERSFRAGASERRALDIQSNPRCSTRRFSSLVVVCAWTYVVRFLISLDLDISLKFAHPSETIGVWFH